MDKKAVVGIIERFVQELQLRGIQPQQVILFGSQAKGSATETSDIDVVVISENFSGRSHWERIEVLADAIYAVYAPVEAVAMTPEEWLAGDSMIVDFARQGEVLYAA
jgi:predicted nucleotidyltransferase